MKQLAVPEPLGPQGHYTPSGTGDALDIRSLMGILHRRKLVFAQAFVAVLLVGVTATMLSKTVYQTTAKLLVPPVSSAVNLVDASNPIATIMAYKQPDSVTAQAQVLQSPAFVKEVEQQAGILPRRGVVSPTVKVKVLQEGSQLTNVIEVTVKGGNPEEIARMANTLVDTHIRRTDDIQNLGLTRTIDDLRQEKGRAEERLKKATTALFAFRRTHNVARLDAEQKSRGEQLVTLQTQQQEAAGNIASLQEQWTLLQARLRSEPRDLAYARVQDNPLRKDLEEQIRLLEVKRTSLLEKFQPDSDDVRDVEGEIARFKRRLESTPRALRQPSYAPNPRLDMVMTQLSTVEGELSKARQDYAEASAALAEQQRQSGLVEPWEIRLTTLTEEREQARERYSTLSNRLQDLEIQRNAGVQTVRAIERAEVPTIPVQPNRPMLLVLSSVFAVVLATGIAFLVEYMDDRLNESEDVQRLFALPTLAHVPRAETEDTPVVTQLPAQSHLAEAYRALRSSIEFAAIDSAIQCLQVTSASKGEGKSTTAFNLATAMAMAGKRVILVDADLRRPAIHRMLEIPSSPGLTDVLIGTASLDAVIQDTGVNGLRVVCAGPIPPNPAELLASNAFAHVLEQLEARADLIVVDTPPCAPVTDPIIVAARMDAVLLVVNAGSTRKPVLSHALEMLGRARARVIGVVLNRVDAGQKGYYYYQYGGYNTEAPESRKRRRKSNGQEARPALGVSARVRDAFASMDDEDAN